jgi:hypothetical protein
VFTLAFDSKENGTGASAIANQFVFAGREHGLTRAERKAYLGALDILREASDTRSQEKPGNGNCLLHSGFHDCKLLNLLVVSPRHQPKQPPAGAPR